MFVGQIVSKWLIFASSAVLLAACASDSGLFDEPGYVAGFGDGCATAHEEDKSFSTKRVRDAELFETDKAYRSGWRQGWQQCQSPYRKADDGGRILGDEPSF
jgi:hypothetical protein